MEFHFFVFILQYSTFKDFRDFFNSAHFSLSKVGQIF